MKKAVCILSGGMDSATATHWAKAQGYAVVAVHFDYGQRTQTKEASCFHRIADDVGAVSRYQLDLSFIKAIGASALVDESIAVPTGGIEPGVPVTYVPFRNGIFLSAATAIIIGVVEEDSSGYPDCREAFLSAFEKAGNLGTKEETRFTILSPLVHLKKEEIVLEASKLGVDFSHTWSCYQFEDAACGVCDSCRLRLKGFREAGLTDPIPYR